MNYYPGIEQDAAQYVELQQRQQQLLEELKNQNPSLFKRMMRAGLLAILGMIGAKVLDQDPVKGAVGGAAASVFLTKSPPREMPKPVPYPPYRLNRPY